MLACQTAACAESNCTPLARSHVRYDRSSHAPAAKVRQSRQSPHLQIATDAGEVPSKARNQTGWRMGTRQRNLRSGQQLARWLQARAPTYPLAATAFAV